MVNETDIIGKQFGQLTVVAFKARERKSLKYECLCKCGRTTIVTRSNLLHNMTRSCGCQVRKRIDEGDIVGRRFGSLTVERFHHRTARTIYYQCSCDCGGSNLVLRGNLISGRTKCCIRCSPISKRNPKIGALKGSIWRLICKGAQERGIEVTITMAEVSTLFDAQQQRCALSGVPIVLDVPDRERPQRTASLDRIDSRLGYVSGNVQWVHKTINKMKADLDQTDFISWCEKVRKT
jgi:hypothetical protein